MGSQPGGRGPGARPHCHARRRDRGDLFGLSRRGGGHGLDLPGAEGGVFGARAADEPLYGSRLALFLHHQDRRDRSRLTDSRRPGAGPARGRAYRGLFAAGERPLRADVRNAAGSSGQGAQARRRNRDRGGQRLHARGLPASPQCPFRGSAGRRSPESPMRPHFVRARVKVHVYPDGSHALFHGPRCIGRYDQNGRLKDDGPVQCAA